jgi:chaperonin cofactor prefoldin
MESGYHSLSLEDKIDNLNITKKNLEVKIENLQKQITQIDKKIEKLKSKNS